MAEAESKAERGLLDDWREISSLGDTCLRTSFSALGHGNGRKRKQAGGSLWVGTVYEEEVAVEEEERQGSQIFVGIRALTAVGESVTVAVSWE